MIFVREDIPSKMLSKHTFPYDIEALIIEINLRKSKFLLLGAYHPPSQPDHYFFDNLSRALDLYSDAYEKMFLVGDFNTKVSAPCLSEFMYQNEIKCLVKHNTCFKNVFNPSCVDLSLLTSLASPKLLVSYLQDYLIFIR